MVSPELALMATMLPGTRPAIYPGLEGHAILVTGGAAGIGAAIVRAFAGQGARVAFCDRDEAGGAALSEATGAAFHPCDVTDLPALEEVVLRAGPLHALINNAGHDERHAVEDVTPGYWRDRLAVNLDHVFFASRAARPGMAAAGGGSIVTFGSTNWMVGGAGLIAYQAAKAAIHGLTKGLAREFGAERIRVNGILPGWVMTERQRTLWLDEAGERLLAERQCLPDRVEPEDVADMALLLASDAARMCTGQFLTVDAGWS